MKSLFVITFLINSILKLIKCENTLDWQNYVSNDLTSIKFSDKKITRFDGIEQFNSSLIIIHISYCSLKNTKYFQYLFSLKVLELKSNQISDISSVSNLIQLEKLDFYGNKISNIDALENLANLTSLNLGKNQIESVTKLNKLKNLIYLNLENNLIKDLDFEKVYFPNMAILNLEYNYLEKLPAEVLSMMPNLNELYLGGNQIKYVGNVSFLSSLTKFDIRRNKIEQFNFKSTKLHSISLDFNNLREFKISNCVYLTYISAESSNISTVEDTICKLNKLQSLVLNNNSIENIDCLSFENKNITKLYINKNNIENIDSIINNITSLRILQANNNKIKKVNFFTTDESEIFILELAHNQIENIDFLSKLSNLTKLDIQHNDIKNVDALKNLTKLTRLVLNDNKIEVIDGLQNLTNLVILTLHNNKIKFIDSLKNLVKLTYLQLNDNQIENVDYINRLTLIQFLYLNRNKISSIQNQTFSNFKRVKQLDLSENNLTNLFDCKPFKLEYINLSNNQLENVDLLSKFTSLVLIDLNNNQLSSLNSDIILSNNNLSKIDYSNNQIKNGKMMEKINQKLQVLFLDKKSINYFSKVKNDRFVMSKGNVMFLKSISIILNDDLNFIDFDIQLEFLKRNIHLNLYYHHQIERFISFTSISD